MRARTILLPVAGLSLAVLGGVLSANTSGLVIAPSYAGETNIAVSIPEATQPVTTKVGTGSVKSGAVTAKTFPTVSITYPVDSTTYGADWTGTITGTASSGAGTTVKSTEVAIEDSTTKHWWSGSSFSASSQIFVPVSGTTTWMLPLGPGKLTSGDSYSVIAQATDSAGNVGTSSSVSSTYFLRTAATPPTVSVTYPVDHTTYGADWTGTITGTASSNSGASTTIASTAVAIEDTSATKWWSGSSFSASTQTFVPVSGTTTWMLALEADNLTSGDSYSIVAQATDSAGNVGTSSPVAFTYGSTTTTSTTTTSTTTTTTPPTTSTTTTTTPPTTSTTTTTTPPTTTTTTATTPPTVSVTYPVDHTSYGADWTGTITGTASSGASTTIASTQVAIEDTTADQWWNGTSFSASSQTFVPASGTTAWNLSLEADNLTSGDSYSVVAQATDSAGNVGTSSTVSFTYGTTTTTSTTTTSTTTTTTPPTTSTTTTSLASA
jgi:hypothetical protein